MWAIMIADRKAALRRGFRFSRTRLAPTEIRAGAVGVGTSLSRIGAAVGTWLVPVSLQTVGIGTTMYIAAAITFFGLIVSWFLAPETNARSLEDAASLDDSPRQKVAMSAPLTRRNTL
jgi:putative MFS transporter